MHLDVVTLITRFAGPRNDEVSELTERKCENPAANLMPLRNAMTYVIRERAPGGGHRRLCDVHHSGNTMDTMT